jgi:hypothetical protein
MRNLVLSFIVFIVLFVSCKEHSTEPIYKTVPDTPSFTVSNDTLYAKVLILSDYITGSKMVLNYNSLIVYNNVANYGKLLFSDDPGTLEIDILRTFINNRYTKINSDLSLDLVTSNISLTETNNLELRIQELEKHIAELESKFGITKQNF